ncbi:RNA polymerase sigma factor [Microlunatus phosphovorus NM-1]|uniref:RNA polymerase sigma factor n=1 Tax=Microlunatus phosphovorus (strain ATCC 700054 / DSM 10555 / JCM 9379 / NBRC 101784 / NCIMB 13414 / VKM Ac-1990 / NM-1) TaxID=1032480 RepID=F5XMB4_MICPN|nr:sigma-70 family RNA polymerase sigma factor [Microlunatus phosphovorus]BAK36371.1 RNA polymerase sigma factor [Microlunatus phosphovorus NM-1]
MDDSALLASPALDAPLLTPEEEVQLARQIEAGVLAADALFRGLKPHGATAEELRWLVAAGEEARFRYVQSNLRLVAMVVLPASARAGLPEADLFQEGCLGLLIAVDRFDVSRGCRFATYALQWIRAFVNAASARLLGTMNLPASRAVQLRQARGIEALLTQELGRVPSAQELASALGRPQDWTERLLAHEHPQALHEVGDLPDEDKDLERVLAGEGAAELLRVLHGLDRRVMELLVGFAGEPLTYAQVARELQMTSNRVRRAEQRALQRLREVCPQAARDLLAG